MVGRNNDKRRTLFDSIGYCLSCLYMIHFFRDILDGPLYIALVVICIILIMSIIGFIMDRKKLEKEENEKRVVVGGITPMDPVRTREVVLNTGTNTDTNVEIISNPLTNPENNLPKEEIFTIDSSNVQVDETVVDEISETKVEDVAEVIDFGSTKDVDIDNN